MKKQEPKPQYRTNVLGENERQCPDCGQWTQADHVHNGIGWERCGPYHCEACGWIEAEDPLRSLLKS